MADPREVAEARALRTADQLLAENAALREELYSTRGAAQIWRLRAEVTRRFFHEASGELDAAVLLREDAESRVAELVGALREGIALADESGAAPLQAWANAAAPLVGGGTQ